MKSPALMLHVARGVISRLRTQTRRSGTASSLTVAVTAPVDADELTRAIADAIGRFGTVRHLSSSIVDGYLNRPDISQATSENVGVPRLTEFMHEADLGTDHVVLQTDSDVTGWTRRALRQADRVLLVVSARPDDAERARLSELLDVLHDLAHVRRMLAVVHPAGTDRPRNTARLVADVAADEVVHVRVGSTPDIGRVARLASGHGVGLVLSGGGARGFAHLGAVRALARGRGADRCGRWVFDGSTDRRWSRARPRRRRNDHAGRGIVPQAARLHRPGRGAPQGRADQQEHRSQLRRLGRRRPLAAVLLRVDEPDEVDARGPSTWQRLAGHPGERCDSGGAAAGAGRR